MHKLLWVALVVLCAVYAPGQAAPKAKFPPIVFDDWWNVDYVKNGCEMAAHDGTPCLARTPQEVVTEFENELEVAFASESACHGLSLIHFTPEMVADAVKNPNAPASPAAARTLGDNWWLMLDLDGHSRTQTGRGWTVVDSARHALNGRITTPQRVMQQVCKIAKGVGGKNEAGK